MQAGIYQLTYWINQERRLPNRYIALVPVDGGATIAVHLRREEDGTYVTRRYDLVPQMKAMAIGIEQLQPDDVRQAGAINSCEILERVEPDLEKIVADIRRDSRQFVQTCRQNGAL